MKTVKRPVLQEFHYAMDGRNPVRQAVGSTAEIRAEDEEKLVAEGKIEGAVKPSEKADDESAKGKKK